MLHPPLPQTNVISLDAARTVRQQPLLAVVEDYWDSLRDGRLVPGRDEIDPRSLAGALSRAFVIERIAPGQARFRVAGSHISALVGAEARGMPLSVLFDPTGRERLADALATLFDAPAVMRLALSSAGGIGRPALTGGMVLLPLLDRDEVRTAFGALSMGERTGRAPRALAIRGVARRDLGLSARATGTP
jgi:hypothetical protein